MTGQAGSQAAVTMDCTASLACQTNQVQLASHPTDSPLLLIPTQHSNQAMTHITTPADVPCQINVLTSSTDIVTLKVLASGNQTKPW